MISLVEKSSKIKQSPFEKELIKNINKIKEYKLACEANIISIIWKKPDILHSHEFLKLEDFTENTWKVYFAIAYGIIIKEGKSTLDDITVGLYLEKHKKLSSKYNEYGGYEKIESAKKYVKVENIQGYINELNKWNSVLKLLKFKFPIHDKIKDFVDMSIEEIYDEYEAKLNHIFINAEEDVKSYCITEGLDELIDKLDEGFAVGLPYYGLDMINKETGGQLIGNITLVGGLSNVGKSTFARSTTIPSIIKEKERLVIMINEEGREKWQREMLVWIANNIFKEDLQKYVVRDGNYTKNVKDLLHKCAEWLREKGKDRTITIIPFTKYKTSKAIKVMKKYASMGVKYFILDTFKQDSGNMSAQTWLEMSQAMVDINDTVKPESKNLHILITFQLSKGSSRQRYFTQDNTGVAKNIMDPAAIGIMIRDLLEDEYEGGKNELKVYRLEGRNRKTKIPVKLDRDKRYQILFIVKNREGAANSYQIVVEHDLSRNVMKEIGITHVSVDW